MENHDRLLSRLAAIVQLIQSGGGVMTMDDLKSCDAEVIKPIKYDYRGGKSGTEGVTLWEVSSASKVDRSSSSDTVPSEWTRFDSAGCPGHNRGV